MTSEYIKEKIINKFGLDFFEKHIAIHDLELKDSDSIVFCCAFHGFFSKTIYYIVRRKYLCPFCGIEAGDNSSKRIAKNQRRSSNDLAEELKAIHKNKYEYPREIIATNKRMTVRCKFHGDFEIYYNSHKNGTGCQKCEKEYFENKKKKRIQDAIKRRPEIVEKLVKRLKEKSIPFCVAIKRFKNKHGERYEYDESSYVNFSSKIRIRCKIHGWFTQHCGEHEKATHGCRLCAKKISSSKEISWLKSLGIKVFQKQIKTDTKTFRVDGFCDETNTVFEFLGDYWHGNPMLEDKRGITVNKISKKTLKQLFLETEERFIQISKLGYKIIYKWESNDYNFLFDGKLKTCEQL